MPPLAGLTALAPPVNLLLVWSITVVIGSIYIDVFGAYGFMYFYLVCFPLEGRDSVPTSLQLPEVLP